MATPDDIQLLKLLRSLPVPDPGEEYERLLLHDVLHSTRLNRTRRARVRSQLWVRWGWQLASVAGVFLICLATASHWKVVMPPPVLSPVAQQRSEISRPLHILLESPREMRGATIRITLPDTVAIEGYRDVHQLRWRADIAAGGNRLYLPVQIRDGGVAGEILIEVEYQGASKLLRLPVSPLFKPTQSNSLTRI
ncbi:hypothetical protein SAMN04487965_2646 [Microbulbifer donghaiensis]|uniref:Uncharacterized protein n=2 Tax=Microbulbifer donghaiensis TaxID=494016 RepID=A0A1M5EBA2_9GAMM|nr:hypothetical protein SAMN04487965_2646 [Microbulbifer donghaiensis]